MSRNLAGQPDHPETMPISDLDMHDEPCELCGAPGPTALAMVTGRGTTAAGKTCVACLNPLVAEATAKGDAMVTAKAGGAFRQLVTPREDGSLPESDGTVSGRIEGYMTELGAMVERDPHAGTEHETSFLRHNKERARQIGAALFEIGGHGLMVGVHDAVRAKYRGASARHLEIAWEGVGQWRA